MARDYILPPEVDLTVDDLAILPDECRYELIEGKLDLWDRQPLPQLAPLALMAELMAASPPGFQVVSRRPLDAEGHAPDVTVLDSGGQVVLVVDVIRSDRCIADALELMRAYSASGVPTWWIFEVPEWANASLTVLQASNDGVFRAESTTRFKDFVAQSPYPVSIDIYRLSSWWPQTFEYAGPRSDEGDRR
jgi:hypothetical protein